MQWLISQMWIALSAAGFLGLLFGMAIRGLFGGNKIRRARVERDVALTELDQSRTEVDALYAAQRKRQDDSAQTAQAVSGDDSLKDELEQRETKIIELGSELMSARSELESLRASGGDAKDDLVGKAGAALAGAVAGAALNQDDADDLKSRNTWLEERVASLEADVGAAAPVATVSEGEPSTEKVQWQNSYLRQRVDALEHNLAAVPAVAAAPVVAAVAEAVTESGGGDEELARLRWRNRYLEGRLAYHEDGGEAEELVSETSEEPDLSVVETVPEDIVPDAEEAVDEAVAEVVEAAPEDAAHPAEALLKELDEEGT